ncbi:glycine/sarcosine/betaine reductase selenoprotein B family protein [Effusibacillus lacus]|uniref:Proline reductase n=1 Tax=Effusibacillus lacus TaxID=1348429 RepID=A0A292YPY3_9BACL|nr:glycine/sarcosine/betaine reductase selenoprotein B family protein [Effusibacillus lacus]TCS75648.1 D-proline reductase (dithiol) PrdB [Effusibacillus lacus]GAX90971.1 hypothetical protein EFBL_2631 [Effusibacillus lacus]
MKWSTKIKSKIAVAYSSNFIESYKKFTLKHVRKNENVPEALLQKPLDQCKVALITTAGVHLKSDPPFNVDNPAGDHTIRIISSDAKAEDLEITHIYYDTKFAKADPSVVFPLQQIRELAENGVIGAVSNVNIGLNGGILDTTLVETESIPKAVFDLTNEQVDIALLVPG